MRRLVKVFYFRTPNSLLAHMGATKFLLLSAVRFRLGDVTLLPLSTNQRSFIAGACASAVGQTMVVPIDVISQHLMVLRGSERSQTSGETLKRTFSLKKNLSAQSFLLINLSTGKRINLSPLRLTPAELENPRWRAFGVIKAIWRRHGILGYYQGYFISICTFVPNSALWWAFYNHYCREGLHFFFHNHFINLFAAKISSFLHRILLQGL